MNCSEVEVAIITNFKMISTIILKIFRSRFWLLSMFARALCAFCYTFWKMMYCKDIIQEEKSNVIFLAKVKKLTRTCANNFQTILRCTLTQVAKHCPKIWNTRLTLGSHNQRVLFIFSDGAAPKRPKKEENIS